MKKFKYSTLLLAVLSSSYAASADSAFTMRVTTISSTSVWVDTSTVKSDWYDVEGEVTCGSWTPDTSKVLLDESFIQSQSCEQLQNQDVVAEQYDSVSGETRTTSYTNERYVTETDTQEAVGTMSAWVFIDSEYTDWEYTGVLSYSDWTPESADQTEEYEQTRYVYTYKQRYEQMMQEYNSTGETRTYGNPTLRSDYDISDESRSVSVTEGSWEYVDTYYDCDDWVVLTDDEDATYYEREASCIWKNVKEYDHQSDGETVYTYEEIRYPTGTISQFVQTYSCSSTKESEYGYVTPWEGCVVRE